MSSAEVRKVSPEDIQMVQNLIEQYLPRYLTQKEVTDILHTKEKIEPSFTELVWQKLEEQNQEFFKAYHLRLMVKEQIMEFNKLLDRQVTLMHQANSTGVVFQPVSNGSHMAAMHQKAPCYAPKNAGMVLKDEYLQRLTGNLPGGFNNCGPSMHSGMQRAVDMSAQCRRIDVPPNRLLAQGSTVGMLQGMNGIKTETGYLGSSRYVYGADGNVLEARPSIGDASVSSFGSLDDSNQLNGALLNDNLPFEEFGNMSQSFGLVDLRADFANNILRYSRSDSFLDSRISTVEHQGENKSLDTVSDFNNFSSDS